MRGSHSAIGTTWWVGSVSISRRLAVAAGVGMASKARTAARRRATSGDRIQSRAARSRRASTGRMRSHHPPGVAPSQLLELALRDKKVRAGRLRWVLPTALGAATVRDDLPEALVREVVESG